MTPYEKTGQHGGGCLTTPAASRSVPKCFFSTPRPVPAATFTISGLQSANTSGTKPATGVPQKVPLRNSVNRELLRLRLRHLALKTTTEINLPPHHQEDSAAPLVRPAARRLRAFATVLLGNRRRFLPRRCLDHHRHHRRNDDKEREPAGHVQACLQRERCLGVPIEVGIAHGVQIAK